MVEDAIDQSLGIIWFPNANLQLIPLHGKVKNQTKESFWYKLCLEIQFFHSNWRFLVKNEKFATAPPQSAKHSLIITKLLYCPSCASVLQENSKIYYVQFLNFTCFIVLTSSLNAPKEGDTWGINYMSFDLAEDKTRGHVINCKAFVVYTSTLFFSKIFIHPNSFFSSSWWFIYVLLYDAPNVISDPLAADCRLQTAILSQNSRTQAEPK